MLISKNEIFGVFTIIYQIHLWISLQVKKRKNILESPNLLLLEKNKIFIFDTHRTSNGHLKVWSKLDKFDPSGVAT